MTYNVFFFVLFFSEKISNVQLRKLTMDIREEENALRSFVKMHQHPLSFRLRVVSNFGDGDCGAGGNLTISQGRKNLSL